MLLVSSVAWPSAPFTVSLVLKSLSALSISHSLISTPPKHVQDGTMLLQWSTYDEIDHELTHIYRNQCLSSSYTIRKALIRKHFLSNCIHSYVVKNPSSILTDAFPITYEIEISFADELDELWTDELWELAKKLEESNSWWILKPGMADRGMGIRLFDNKDALRCIFEEFDCNSEDESNMDAGACTTSVVTSQLRHFVVQEYVNNPLLIDSSETAIVDHAKRDRLRGHKFHLRAYCVASRALELYLYDRVLALFSAVPYEPLHQETPVIDLSPHLTNTSLQAYRGEECVRLLQELVGSRVLSGNRETERKLTTEDVDLIVQQIGEVLSETFKAALQMPVHFQTLPNAFELFGVDFLVYEDGAGLFKVKLLEINAEPAIELTGPRLSWVLEDLFIAIGKVCIEPFFARKTHEGWERGETRDHLMKCLAEEVHW